jgi:hypothetical protein
MRLFRPLRAAGGLTLEVQEVAEPSIRSRSRPQVPTAADGPDISKADFTWFMTPVDWGHKPKTPPPG